MNTTATQLGFSPKASSSHTAFMTRLALHCQHGRRVPDQSSIWKGITTKVIHTKVSERFIDSLIMLGDKAEQDLMLDMTNFYMSNGLKGRKARSFKICVWDDHLEVRSLMPEIPVSIYYTRPIFSK
jgi:hypothetical protein